MKTAFEAYLYASSPQVRLKVFEWVSHQLDNRNLSDRLKDEILLSISSKLRELAEIDSKKTQRLLTKYFEEKKELELIKGLKSYPHLQFGLLENKIEFETQEGKTLEATLLIMFISMLCKKFPKKVCQEIKKGIYPLKDCLDLVIRHGIREAEAYLYEKMGSIEKARDLYQGLFVKKIEKSIKKLETKDSFSNSFSQLLTVQSHLCFLKNRRRKN